MNNAGGAGGLGAEAHAPGTSKKVVKLGQTNGAAPPSEVGSPRASSLKLEII